MPGFPALYGPPNAHKYSVVLPLLLKGTQLGLHGPWTSPFHRAADLAAFFTTEAKRENSECGVVKSARSGQPVNTDDTRTMEMDCHPFARC